MKQPYLVSLLSLTLMIFGCSPSEPESEDVARQSTPTTEVPAGRFDLVPRYYLPHEEIITGEWTSPKIGPPAN